MSRGRGAIHDQRGAALIMAVMVVALGATLAVGMLQTQKVAIMRTARFVDRVAVRQIAYSGEALARAVLIDDYLNNGDLDTLEETWAQPLPPSEIDRGSVAGKMVDLQGRFNLNDIVEYHLDKGGWQIHQSGFAALKLLLEHLGLSTDLAYAALDWADSDDEVSGPGGAESDVYFEWSPPRRAGNHPFITTRELLEVEGFSEKLYWTIEPYLAALPVRTQVNINTASPEVVAAVTGIPLPVIEEVVDKQGREGFESLAEFRDLLPKEQKKDIVELETLLSVHSSFFKARMHILFDKEPWSFRIHLKRDKTDVRVYLRGMEVS